MEAEAIALLSGAISRAVKPRRVQSVWQWAEDNVVLSVRSTNSPGRYDSSWVPYVREWQDSFTDPSCKEVAICAGAQTGKTESLMNCVRYAVANDPGPMLWVTAAETLARSFSEQRLQPSLRDCPACATQIVGNKDKFKLLEMHLADMTMNLVGANSPGQLASRPVRYLFLDETDKFPGTSSKEAGAVDLAKVRTTTFWNRKIMLTSTPTVEGGEVWQAYLAGDQRKFFCPCPHCGALQYLEFSQLKWPSEREGREWDVSVVERDAWYECKHCERKIEQKDKATMVRAGEWAPTNKGAPADMRSYHISTLYSPWRSWGSVAREFLESKESYSALQNFVNSVLAEPWKHDAEEVSEDRIASRREGYRLKEKPEDVVLVTMTADVGRDYIYATVRGWGKDGESWLLDYAKLPDFEALEEMTAEWKPVLGLCDSGFRTLEVYTFCSGSDRIWWPAKGHDTLPQVVRASPITFYEAATYRERRIKLFHFNASALKGDLYLHRIQDGEGKPWHVPVDIGSDYMSQLCAEQLVPKKNARGVEVQQWVQVRRDNHLGDCEVMQLAIWHLVANKALPERKIKPKPVDKKREMVRARRRLSRRKKWR